MSRNTSGKSREQELRNQEMEQRVFFEVITALSSVIAGIMSFFVRNSHPTLSNWLLGYAVLAILSAFSSVSSDGGDDSYPME